MRHEAFALNTKAFCAIGIFMATLALVVEAGADMGEPPRAGQVYRESQEEAKAGHSKKSASKVVQEFYEKLGQGDLPGMMEAFSDDAKWVLYGPSIIPFAGEFAGREAIKKFIETFGKTAQVKRFEPKEFVSDKYKVVVHGYEEAVALSTGKTWKAHWSHSFTVQRGKIVLVEEVLDTAPVAEAFTP